MLIRRVFQMRLSILHPRVRHRLALRSFAAAALLLSGVSACNDDCEEYPALCTEISINSSTNASSSSTGGVGGSGTGGADAGGAGGTGGMN